MRARTVFAPAPAPSASAGAGLRIFAAVWLGQTLSELGNGMTAFALSVWVYQSTGSVSAYAGILVFALVPAILLSPLAGSLVDRHDRRLLMIGADTAAALSTAAVALLAATGRLEVWHVYAAVGWSSLCMAVQRPAWASSVALLVPREQLGRAAGMMQMGQGATQLLAPLLGGMLVVTGGLAPVVLVDAATFVVAATATALVRIPRPPASGASSSLFRSAAEGWRYTLSRGGLLAVTLFFTVLNLGIGFLQALLAPLVLSYATAERLGAALSTGAAGMVVGGVVMSASGGPARRVRGMVVAGWLMGLALLGVGARPSVVLAAVSLAVFFSGVAFASACNQALLQSRVPPEMQGRVFATLRMLAWSSAPVAYVTASPLVNEVFSPLAARGGLQGGWTHAGGGPALLLAAMGCVIIGAALTLHVAPAARALDLG